MNSTTKSDCFYARIIDCGAVRPGFTEFGRALALASWATFALGLALIVTEVTLRRRRRRKADAVAVVFGGGGDERESGVRRTCRAVWRCLTVFEWFIALLTVDTFLGAVALTLSSFRNTDSITCLMSVRNTIVISAIVLHMDSLLATTASNNPTSRVRTLMRRVFLPYLTLLTLVTIFQGVLSERSRLGMTDTVKVFNLVMIFTSVLFIGAFAVIIVFVMWGRGKLRRYARELKALEQMEIRVTGKAMSFRTPGTVNSNPEQLQNLESAIATLGWAVICQGAFLVFEVIFCGFQVSLNGSVQPDYLVFLVLLFNWCSPTLFSLAVFITLSFALVRKLRDPGPLPSAQTPSPPEVYSVSSLPRGSTIRSHGSSFSTLSGNSIMSPPSPALTQLGGGGGGASRDRAGSLGTGRAWDAALEWESGSMRSPGVVGADRGSWRNT
ncbi:hypothetical protein HK101_009699 [Irineochytrium annulatum]|nr:hypothetical protein HK101_009699 [Irineochytrium annulatum]